MKKAIAFCLLMTALIFTHSVEAKILRVAYSGPAVAGVDYSNVQAAVNAAAVDDTIQLYQNASVGSATVNKRLVFLGFGYRLEFNPALQALPSAGNYVDLNFVGGSEGSVVQGALINRVNIGVNDITVSRCLGDLWLGYNSTTGLVPITNVTIISSWLNIRGDFGAVSNALVNNCILDYLDLPNVAGLFSNNILLGNGNWRFGSCVVRNNIFTYQSRCVNGTSAIFQHNLFARNDNCGITITGSNNQFGVNMTNVFLNWNNGSFGSESNLALKAGSPALGFGVDGNGNPTDAGIYGGDAGLVYKPSGIPPIPAIYHLTSPGLNANTNPYTITVSVRSNN